MEVPVGGRRSPGLSSLPVLLPAALLQPAKQQLLALPRATCGVSRTQLTGDETQKLPTLRVNCSMVEGLSELFHGLSRRWR